MSRIGQFVAAGAYSLGSPFGLGVMIGVGLLLWHWGAF